jgi:transcriptional regulator with XRE-family HTH domain
MTSTQLPNYLRANRKRLALSQDEVAFLLGTNSGTKACRYERFTREPSLQTALEYEAIFQRSVSELFSGMYRRAEQDVAERAKILIKRPQPAKVTAQITRKREALAALVSKAQ